MLSYLHGYHAGNFADVHKHHLLTCILRAFNQKPSPWHYLETHAGKGLYALDSAESLKTAEFTLGIQRIWHNSPLPESVQAYMQLIQHVNPDKTLRFYPGSPCIASLLSRPQDKLSLMELHPNEVHQLKAFFAKNAQVSIHHRDGYEGVLSLLPPKPNRGVVMIDPSYEVKREYESVVQFLEKAHKRWPNGCYIIWYPLLAAQRSRHLVQRIQHSGIRSILSSEIHIDAPNSTGMFGSGLLIVNPPWQLEQTLQHSEPWLLSAMQRTGQEHYLSWLVPE